MHERQKRDIRRYLRIHVFRGLRNEEVRRGILAVAYLGALCAGRLVRPDEIVGLVQRDGIVGILAGRLVDAGQMVAVENHGDRLVQLVQLGEELLGGLVGQAHALGVGFDGFGFRLAGLAVGVRRLHLVLVVGVPVLVWHVVLHGDDLHELVVVGAGNLLERALVGRFVAHIRRLAELALVFDGVGALERIEMREAELFVVRCARVHGRLVRVEGDGIRRRSPQPVDGRRPRFTRHELLVGAGQRGTEVRHAQAGESHVFKIRRAAAIAAGQHEAAGRVFLD